MTMTTEVKSRAHFFEGGNIVAIIAVSAGCVFLLVYYPKAVALIGPLQIKVEDVYSYVFHLFAIEFGALLALFALFACRPTLFLERIKNTQAFSAIMTNTKITMAITTLIIIVTFVLGILRFQPENSLGTHSKIFIAWIALVSLGTCFYARTVRLIFTALA